MNMASVRATKRKQAHANVPVSASWVDMQRDVEILFTNGLRLQVRITNGEGDRIERWSQLAIPEDPFIVFDGEDGFTYVLNGSHLAVVSEVVDFGPPDIEEQRELRRMGQKSHSMRLYTVGRETPMEVELEPDVLDPSDPENEINFHTLWDFVGQAEGVSSPDEPLILEDADDNLVCVRSAALVAAIFPTRLQGNPYEDGAGDDDSESNPEDLPGSEDS